MRRILPPDEFASLVSPGSCRGPRRNEPSSLFTPAEVLDRTDPQLVHLDGLNLNRAWTMRSIAARPPRRRSRAGRVASASAEHARAGLAQVASGDYAGEHWLASFAVYLLDRAWVKKATGVGSVR